ncbi:hypothetical protein [Luteolibacter soli]|uniref:Uncharacterized protein n=1 Tax=Luteolibacter soli TaxID=3135280 RepID=A0ABU9AYC1_9BACT
MKTFLGPFAAGVALALVLALGTTARCEFEMWKNKEGKAAELEITGVDDGAAGTQVRFRTKAGKEVLFKLEDLAAEDQVRAKGWKAKPPISASFGYVTDWPALVSGVEAGKPVLQFTFDVKGESALAHSDIKISNPKLSAGGKELEVTKWSGVVDDGTFLRDPFATPPAGLQGRKWSLVITAEGEFAGVTLTSCEFSADVEVYCGRAPKEITTTMPLPKATSFEAEEEQHHEKKKVDPFTIEIGTSFWPLPGKKDKDDGVVTGYHLGAVENPEMLDLVPDGGGEPVISTAFVVKGKEYPNAIYKKDITSPATILVKYWSEGYAVPLKLSKAASNRGRNPPPKPEVNAGGEGEGGGKDPFGG